MTRGQGLDRARARSPQGPGRRFGRGSRRFPGGGMVGAKVALRRTAGTVFRMPRQFGPISRIPDSRQTSISSRWRSVPAAPVSAKPAEMTTTAGTPFAAHSRATALTAGAGTAITARSSGSGTSSIVGYARTDWTTSAFGLTGWTTPVKPPSSRLWKTRPRPCRAFATLRRRRRKSARRSSRHRGGGRDPVPLLEALDRLRGQRGGQLDVN